MTHRREAVSAALLVLAVAAGLAACDSADPEDESSAIRGVVVASQGNFSDGNGSVLLFDPADGSRRQLAQNLGTIIQSVMILGDDLMIASNTGDRVDIVDIVSGNRTDQVAGVASPRYFARDGDRIFVTSLFDNSVAVISNESREVAGRIEVGDNPEGMVVSGRSLFVANHGFGAGRTLSEVSLADLTVVAEHDLGCSGPRHLSIDAEGELIVVCTGQILYDDEFNVIGEQPGSILVVDPGDAAVVSRLDLAVRLGAEGPGQDAYMSAERNDLFVVFQNNSVLRFDATSHEVADTIGPLAGAPIGAIGWDDGTGSLYLGHVPSFTSAGTVSIHDISGEPLGSFEVGVAPTFIAFWQGEGS